MVCSGCDTEETSRWSSSKVDPEKPVCMVCYNSQVRLAFRSLTSTVRILSALPGFVTDTYTMYLHRSPPLAATAPTARSPVLTRAGCSSRGSRTAPGSAGSAGAKKRPPTGSAPRARRAWTPCFIGTSRSASRARRGSARRATRKRCAHSRSSHSPHANANARRPPPRCVSGSPRAVRVFPFFAGHRNPDRGGDDVRQVRLVQGQQLAHLPGRARGQGLQKVLASR